MISVLIILGGMTLLILLYFLLLVRVSPKKEVDKRLLCDYAHRGLHDELHPENSLAAFRRAVELGFGIELDVQLSRDGEVFVFHDYLLERMTGVKRRLSELTAAELGRLGLKGTAEKIPRLSEVLRIVCGRVPLLIELKGENLNTSLCRPLSEMLKKYDGIYCLESFNPCLIGKMKVLLPHSFRGLLYTNLCRENRRFGLINMVLSTMSANIIARPDFIAYKKTCRDAWAVKIATRLYGARKFVWTLKSRAEYEAAKAKGELAIFEGFLPDITEV